MTECASLEEDENKDRIWTITAFTTEGISSQRCQNGNILDSWEIKYNNPDDANRVLDVINSFDKDANLVFDGSKTFWENFLKNNLTADSIEL